MLEGSIDSFDGMSLTGWVRHPKRLDVPLEIALFGGSKRIQSTIANLERPDLIGALDEKGLHGFSFQGVDLGHSTNFNLRFGGEIFNLRADPSFVRAKSVYPKLKNLAWIPSCFLGHDDLKIFILATPRCGNTWLKEILRFIYDLPLVEAPVPFDDSMSASWPSQWICHQHYDPRQEFFDWAERKNVVVISIVRHPGDVLKSIFHFVKRDSATSRNPLESSIASDGLVMGKSTERYIRSGTFGETLSISRQAALQNVYTISYEDLYWDPISTLVKLTGFLRPVPESTIRAAIGWCDLENMKRRSDIPSYHFHRSSFSGWDNLPESILRDLNDDREVGAYVQVFGYDTETAARKGDRFKGWNPFIGRKCYSNGTEIKIGEIYEYFRNPEMHPLWGDPTQVTSKNSFYHWVRLDAFRCESLGLIR